MTTVHVSLKGVTKRFRREGSGGEVHALGPIDLELRKGEFFAVVGPSGCGKSTMLELIAGLAEPTAGDVAFEGRPIGGRVPDGIGVVFQEDACFPWLTVEDNILVGLRKAPVPAEETIEIFAFMEAADESKRRGGGAVRIQEVLDKARH